MPEKKKYARSVPISLGLLLFEWFLVRLVKIDKEQIQKIKDAKKHGPIVFVLRNRNLLDFLCLRGLCKKYELGNVSFVNGLRELAFSPLWKIVLNIFRTLSPKKRPYIMKECLSLDGSAVIFLRRPAIRGALGSRPVKDDGIRDLVEGPMEQNIVPVVVPCVLLWGERSMYRLPGTMDFIFGSNEYPRFFRSIWNLLIRRSVHEAIIGKPLITGNLERNPNFSKDALVGYIRTGVQRQIEQMRRQKLGALTKPSARLKYEVASSKRLGKELDAIALDEGIDKREVKARTKSIINKLAADYKPMVLSFFSHFFKIMWKRLYTGIDFPQSDVEIIKNGIARGPCLILPTHRSHADYILISQGLFENNIMLPHIAAGQNLSFWPLGWIFRSGGAFFIRRKFLHDRFYTAVINAYVRRLVQSSYAIEVFIEGSRSRTGKLLRPKLGMIEMALDAMALTPGVNLNILPMYIGYEQVIEENEYVNESTGGKKVKENIAELLKTPKVLFHSYGRLYIRAGTPFSVNDILSEKELSRKDLLKKSARMDVAMKIAMQTYGEIGRKTVVFPSSVFATVLLSSPKNKVTREYLAQKSIWLAKILKKLGATLNATLTKWVTQDESSEKLVDKSIKAFVDGGRVDVLKAKDNKKENKEGKYTVKGKQRLKIDYYKNNTIHFFVPMSWVMASCLSNGNNVKLSQVEKDILKACAIFKWEYFLPGFTLPDKQNPDDMAKQLTLSAARNLCELGIIQIEEESINIIDDENAKFMANLTRNLHEAYFATVLALREKVLKNSLVPVRKLVKTIADEHILSGKFLFSEGQSKTNRQNAFQRMRELKINRTLGDLNPFENGNKGDEIFRFLKRIISTDEDK